MKHTLNIGKGNIEIRALANGIIRVRVESKKEPLLTKYNIISENFEEFKSELKENTVIAGDYKITLNDDTLEFTGGKKTVSVKLSSYENEDEGFFIETDALSDEKLYGFGDENRESLMKKGKNIKIWVRNITSYGPIPFMLSSYGYGITTNCTFEHYYDLCSEGSEKIKIHSKKGNLDFYVFIGKDMPDVLRLYTDLTGKPLVLPKFSYGLTFVNNESDDLRDLLTDCVNFRKYGIPCDVMGLEPNWMSNHYDLTVEKDWNKDKFFIAKWNNDHGPQTLFYNLRALGYKLSLWLCNDYDLFYEEEKNCLDTSKNEYGEDQEIVDNNFYFDMINDKITKQGEGWYEHLKKFTNQGAAVYKLDGAYQVLMHPDRLWGGIYHDDEIHNLYPVVYVKQMKEGFENQTGRRAMIYTPCAYTGIQKYAASWTGDTGGGPKTLIAVLNQSMCAHTNVTCSFNPVKPESVHFGFLSPWTHYQCWRAYHHPWFLEDSLCETLRVYSNLRSELFPYIYSTAHYAAKTGMPSARPMCLVYPDNEKMDNVTNAYMLGDSLMVGAFDMNLNLPEGKWFDYWTKEIYEGGQTVNYNIPSGKAGALLVKEGSVFVTQEPMKYLCEKNPEFYYLNVFPGRDATFTLVEDDGITYNYLKGEMAETKISIKNSKEESFDLEVLKRVGEFKGSAADYDFDKITMSENDPSNIPSMPDVVDFKVRIYYDKEIESISLSGEKIEFTKEDKGFFFVIDKKLHKEKDITYNITFKKGC